MADRPGELPPLLFPDAAALADRALDLVTDLARREHPDAEVAVTTEVGEASLTRFASSAIHQNMTEELLSIRLTVSLGGRTTEVRASGDDPDVLRRLAAAALAAAKAAPVDPDWPGLSPAAAAPRSEHVDAATASTPAAARADRVRAFTDAAGGLECAGFCSTRGSSTVYVNSAGQRVGDSVTTASIDGVARLAIAGADARAPGGLADGSGRHTAIALSDIDAAAAGLTAARTARAAAQEPIDVDPGRWAVVLAPSAVADLLAFLTGYGLGARPHAEGRSFAALGELQFDPSITLVCDPLDPRLPALPFDAEGTPRRTFELVSEGVTRELAADRRDARRFGGQSNGCALDARWMSGGIASAVALREGTLAADELLGGLSRALLVTDFWYTRVLDPRPLTVTGLTRNGLFLIEDGVVSRAARNVRFTQSYAEALAPGNLLGVGDDLTLIGDATQSFLAPSLALRSWNVTGNAQG